MDSEIHFSNNYRDLCETYGTKAGFQFEFSCQRCSDTWRSPFEGYTGARMAGWLQRGAGAASGMLGRIGGDLSSAADGLAGAGWGHAKDASLRRAVTAAQGHFQRCPRCTWHVCARCWNPQQGLCMHCLPDTAAEMAVARQRGLNDAVSDRGYAAGQQAGASVDADAPQQLVCPQCRTETHGAKFCPECGFKMAQQVQCRACPTMLEPGTKFCTECGERQ
jgi:hypothetical protein